MKESSNGVQLSAPLIPPPLTRVFPKKNKLFLDISRK